MNYRATYKPSPETYGGEIEIDDFNTYRPNERRINNQADADKLSHQLQEYIERQSFTDKYKHMTLEELRKLKLVSNTDGRPSSTLTDKKWQTEFELRRMFIAPYKNTKRMGGRYSQEQCRYKEESSYDGATNWKQYCTYINDVLSTIRSGKRDYCYFIYQIMDLLKFHYHDLRTKYCDGYWEVWLEKGVPNGV